jgi:8-oxo-dGTP pyrophosphatase MutT (NUDIX family)
MLKPWVKLRSTPVGDFHVFKVRRDTSVNPRTGKEHDFYVADSVHWVNVVALTPDRQIVMVEQFRHGSQTVELEIPGGMMDAHETDPVLAGTRELREETGYAGEAARLLGRVHANPAIFSNLCYTVIVENCQRQHDVEFDQGEDLITRLVPVADLPRMVATEQIKHPLVVAALYHFELWQRGMKT